MSEVLASLDVLVSLSGGSVMFEAMSCGTPVISAAFTRRQDSVHIQDMRTGLLVSSGRTADLLAAIRNLVESESLRKMIGREAREWAVHNLSHRKMVRRTKRVYQSL